MAGDTDAESGQGLSASVRRIAGLGNAAAVPQEAVPASTVILLRDEPGGMEALMVRRDSRLVFAGGMWVFPGGRVDPADRDPDRGPGGGDDELAAARRAGAREVAEEAGLIVDPASLVPYSHWTPPPTTVKRFATWFFVTGAPAGAVTVDGGEIKAHRWLSPTEALARHHAGEIELAPPTWITLATLSAHTHTDSVLRWAAGRVPDVYVTRIVPIAGGALAVYEGDAGYEDGNVERHGPRHRLSMVEGGWSYVRPDGTIVTG